MKVMVILSCILSFMLCSPVFVSAQEEGTNASAQDTTTVFRIIKTDGTELLGRILSSDEREMLVLTSDGRRIIIPQYVVQEIVAVGDSEYNQSGKFIGEDQFATRYFLTTNGLPIKKGEHYIQWNLFGPDLQFGVADNFGVGVMTSWFGIPLVGTAKYSFQVNEKVQFAMGGLFGTGSWAAPEFFAALPFATLSFGNRSSNIAFSGGYGLIAFDGPSEGRAIYGIGAMTKVGRKVSLVFDSVIVLRGKTTYETSDVYGYDSNGNYGIVGTYQYETTKRGGALLVPGVRIHQSPGQAFQFGFSALVLDGDVFPVPIPMVQWYRTL